MQLLACMIQSAFCIFTDILNTRTDQIPEELFETIIGLATAQRKKNCRNLTIFGVVSVKFLVYFSVSFSVFVSG